ncbi:hypothetical protein GCM10009642_27660 [Nocardiopsis metallicus]
MKTAHRASRAVLGMSTRVIMRARSEVRFSWGMGSLPGGSGGGDWWGPPVGDGGRSSTELIVPCGDLQGFGGARIRLGREWRGRLFELMGPVSCSTYKSTM